MLIFRTLPTSIFRFAIAALLVLAPALGLAETAPTLDESELAPAVAFYGKMISTLGRSITIYNWSDTAAKGDDGPGYLHNGRAGADTFWRHFGENNPARGSYYGSGLYAAVDPVVTTTFGGGSVEKARLLVMDLKPGFKILDFQRITQSSPTLPSEVSKILTKFNCQLASNPESFFKSGGTNLTDDCKRLVRRIFSELLEIDAIAYSYASSDFQGCAPIATTGALAFVLLRETAFQPGDYRFFTSKSTKNLEERIMIQTLMLKLLDDQSALFTPYFSTAWRPALSAFIAENPDHELRSTISKCDDINCTLSAKFCDAKDQCAELPIGTFIRPGGPLITKVQASRIPGLGLLWADLEGKPKAKTTTEYLKATMFGCNGTAPYKDGF